MAVNLDDIAREASVSKAVVSEILRDHPNAMRFSKATRERVCQVARDLRYRPNYFASQIRAQNRKLVMLSLCSLHDPFAANIAQHFERIMTNYGYNFLINVTSKLKNDDFYNQILGEHGILGLVVVGYSTKQFMSDELLLSLADKGVKILTIGRPVESDKIAQIYYDNIAAVKQILDYLLNQNAKRYWLLEKTDDLDMALADSFGINRSVVAMNYLKKFNLPDKPIIIECSSAPQDAEEAVMRALKLYPLPDAIFCQSDYSAWGAIKALTDAGVKVGRDVAVTGFNNNELSTFFKPTLTTIDIPQKTLATKGVEMFLEIYKGGECEVRKVILPTELIIRESGTFFVDA